MTIDIGWVEGGEMLGEGPGRSRRRVEAIESEVLENNLEGSSLEFIHVEEWLWEEKICILWFLGWIATKIAIPYSDDQRLRADAIFSIDNPNLRCIL